MTRADSGATILRTGIPANFTLAGDAWYRSGRRLEKTNAATDTMTTHTTPARTPRASQVPKSVDTMTRRASR